MTTRSNAADFGEDETSDEARVYPYIGLVPLIRLPPPYPILIVADFDTHRTIPITHLIPLLMVSNGTDHVSWASLTYSTHCYQS